jgi:hypothetical protein
MDLTVYPKSRIARLRQPLRLPALLLRALIYREGRTGYTYEGDGLATDQFGPFVRDAGFERSYRELAMTWEPAAATDMRWRMWILTRASRHCRGLAGDFAEFGTWRAGCAFMILATADLAPGTRLLLFDTFEGIPARGLTAGEAEAGFAGRYGDDVSVDYVTTTLSAWSDQVTINPGDVFDTVPRELRGALAFVHIDLNASAATRHVLEHTFPRMASGGMIVFDDYGWPGYEDQREVIDEFFAARDEEVVALPTGQALVVAR